MPMQKAGYLLHYSTDQIQGTCIIVSCFEHTYGSFKTRQVCSFLTCSRLVLGVFVFSVQTYCGPVVQFFRLLLIAPRFSLLPLFNSGFPLLPRFDFPSSVLPKFASRLHQFPSYFSLLQQSASCSSTSSLLASLLDSPLVPFSLLSQFSSRALRFSSFSLLAAPAVLDR